MYKFILATHMLKSANWRPRICTFKDYNPVIHRPKFFLPVKSKIRNSLFLDLILGQWSFFEILQPTFFKSTVWARIGLISILYKQFLNSLKPHVTILNLMLLQVDIEYVFLTTQPPKTLSWLAPTSLTVTVQGVIFPTNLIQIGFFTL